MLPSPFRLPHDEYARLFSSGKRFRTGSVDLLIAAGKMTISRIGIIVPMSSVRKAVKRNRTKRLLREAVRHLLPGLRPYDMILIARKDLSALTIREVEPELAELCVKAKIFSGRYPVS